jgi:hypothetical protein
LPWRKNTRAVAVAAADKAEAVVLDLVGQPAPVGTVQLMVGMHGSMKREDGG